MKKRLILTLILLFPLWNTFAQNGQLTIENLEDNILYRGHDNILKVSLSNYSNITVTCEKCDTLYKRSENKNEYIIRPGRNFDVIIKVVSQNDSLQNEYFRKYQIKSLPKPILFFGSVESKNPYPYNTIPIDLKVKYYSSVKISETFEIINWEFCVKKECFKGKGNEISEKAQNYLSNLKRDKQIIIAVTYIGSDQIRCLLRGYFLIGSKKYRKPQKQLKDIIID
jgi:hypothetical protein